MNTYRFKIYHKGADTEKGVVSADDMYLAADIVRDMLHKRHNGDPIPGFLVYV